MGWHNYADPETDWNDPDAVLRAAVGVSRQYGKPAPPDPDKPRGECWECGAQDTTLYGAGKRCGNCALNKYL